MGKNFIYFGAILFIISTLFCYACNDDDSTENEMTTAELVFNYKVNGQDFVAGQTYNINGTDVQIDFAQFYAGGITFVRQDGAEKLFDGKYLLVKPNSTNEVGKLESGNYKSIRFFVGVDSVNNYTSELDFTSRPPDDPLSIQDPAMHWSWLTGYRFMRIDGKVDTLGNGVVDAPLTFHIGNAAKDMTQFMEFDYTRELTISDNQLIWTVNVEKWFTGIDLATENVTHTGDHQELADKFAANWASAFELK